MFARSECVPHLITDSITRVSEPPVCTARGYHDVRGHVKFKSDAQRTETPNRLMTCGFRFGVMVAILTGFGRKRDT